MDAEIYKSCVCVCYAFPNTTMLQTRSAPVFICIMILSNHTHMIHLIAGTHIMNAYRAISLHMLCTSNSSLLIWIFVGQVGGGVEANKFSCCCCCCFLNIFVVQFNQIFQFDSPHLKWKALNSISSNLFSWMICFTVCCTIGMAWIFFKATTWQSQTANEIMHAPPFISLCEFSYYQSQSVDALLSLSLSLSH